MALPFSSLRFGSDEAALDKVLLGIKLAACPRCQRTGALIGHGFVRGYAERDSQRVVRGRRVFCSNRGRRPGCGRTFSVKLQAVLGGFMVRTLTLWLFVQAIVEGLTRRAAWLRTGGALSLSSGYRLWRRLCTCQSTLRARLCRESAAPACTSQEPWAQLVAHFAVVFATAEGDLFGAYQSRLQRGLFDR